MHLFAKLLVIACLVVIALSGSDAWAQPVPPAFEPAQSPIFDADHDGVADTIDAPAFFDFSAGSPSRIAIRSNGTSGAIYLINSPYGGGDAFGWSVTALHDVNADGVTDLLITAPRAFVRTDRPGRAGVYSGADGSLLATLLGQRGERFGLSAYQVADHNADGLGDFVVTGMLVDRRGVLMRVRSLFSGTDLKLLQARRDRVPLLPPVLTGGHVIRGDVNVDDHVDHDDVVIVLEQALGLEEHTESGDVNQDGTVNVVDVDEVTVLTFLPTPPPEPASQLTPSHTPSI